MKNLTYLLFGLAFLLTQEMQAQKVSNTSKLSAEDIENLDKNYDTLRYYFYPNLDAYFDFKTNEFIYKVDGIWIRNINISRSYRGYSAFNTKHVEILDYFGETPYDNLAANRISFPQDITGKKAKFKASTNAITSK